MHQALLRTGLLAALVLGGAALLAGGCDRSGSSGGSSAEKAKRAKDADSSFSSSSSSMDGDEPRSRTPSMRERAARDSRSRATGGPTGVAECDEALEIVCRCAEKNASLVQPCKTLRADAVRWKARARADDPARLQDIRESCKRILKSIQEAYGCR
jgi:hypothetical protein